MNLWKQFLRLLPEAPLQVATVQALNADGTSRLLLPGGALITARGTEVEVGKPAYVRAGRIEGQAPALPLVEIEL